MKKLVFIVLLCLFVVGVNAQENEATQRIKYITKAPDGSTSIILYDDTRSDIMELQSKNRFYKYQLLDLKTSEPVYASNVGGKTAVINKSKMAEGDYKLKVYTKHFIITSLITITHTNSFSATQDANVASRE